MLAVNHPETSCLYDTVPSFLDEAGLDIPGIVHKDVQSTVDTDSFFRFCVEFPTGSGDVKIKDRSAGVFGILEALSSVPGSGYHSIASGSDSGDEAFSNSGRAACHEPSKLRHYNGEVKDKNLIVRVRRWVSEV